jgi:hypothetical protein
MVRVKKHNGADYVIIDTDLMLYQDGEIATIVPIHVQVRMKDLTEAQQRVIYRNVSLHFDRTLSVNKTEVKQKKGWFSRWFS